MAILEKVFLKDNMYFILPLNIYMRGLFDVRLD